MSLAANLLLSYALNHMGCPYVWGGKGRFVWTPNGLVRHQWGVDVFDCSGLICCAFYVASGLDWRATHSAQRLFEELEKTSIPRAGAVACYGSAGRCEHVMLAVNNNGMVVGASGGDMSTTSPEEAEKRADHDGHPVEVHAYHYGYRKDFLGWRELPIYQE